MEKLITFTLSEMVKTSTGGTCRTGVMKEKPQRADLTNVKYHWMVEISRMTSAPL